MKRAGYLAWLGLAGLLLIAAVFLTGGVIYQSNAMWAGMLAAIAQALVVGLAGWGLKLARENAELEEFSTPLVGQQTSAISPDLPQTLAEPGAGGSKPLETGFQRLVVGIAAFVLVAAAVIATWIIYDTVAWAQANPDRAFPVAGKAIDELGLVIGLGCVGLYGVLYWMTRVKRGTRGYGEAVSSNFTIGLPGMIAIGVAVAAGYLGYAYISEAAGFFMALLLLLQGVELLVNSMRSYAGIEELDEEPADLGRLPLVPMLSSVWLSSVKMLFAASVGLSEKKRGERGVVARMMPRAIVAALVIALLVSCLRVVPAGNVAVLERLGWAPRDAQGKVLLLTAGPHFTMPWPIDQLVMIPTEQLQYQGVGADVHEENNTKGVDFQFWGIRFTGENEEATEYITGEPAAPQLLETYVAIFWRVKDPAKFYDTLSHSDFYEKSGGETQALPIYQAMVQQAAEYAVTKTFGVHTLDQIMTVGRVEVETGCKKELQDKLTELGSGIEIVDLTIKDVHPPFGYPTRADDTVPKLGNDPFINQQYVQWQRGPSAAYENVVSMREIKEALIDAAQSVQTREVSDATGWAKSEISKAQGYRAQKIADAQGEAARLTSMMTGVDQMPAEERSLMMELARKRALYNALTDKETVNEQDKHSLLNINKILVDPTVVPPTIMQGSKNQGSPMVVPAQAGQ